MTRIGSLFSGAGGLDLAVEQVFGGDTVWQCERDAAPSTVLARRFPGVPNHGDITEIDWQRVEPVDVLCGGFPCQDVSAAGRRAGIAEGTRSGLWLEFAKAIDALRPPVVVIENVRGLLSAKANRDTSRDLELGITTVGTGLRAAGAVLGDLADLGYDARWQTVAASSVGAPHKRERVFIVAHPAGEPWSIEHRDSGGTRLPGRSGDSLDLLPTPRAHDGKGSNSPSEWARHTPGLAALAAEAVGAAVKGYSLLPTPEAKSSCAGPDFARASRAGSGGDDLVTTVVKVARGDLDWGKYEPAIRRWEGLTRVAPYPVEPNTKGNPRLAAAFSEWLMGWQLGWATGLITQSRRPGPGEISRNEALRIIGNGVCTQQAYAALSSLTTG